MTAFHEAPSDAMNSYFGNRLNLAPGEVTPEIVLDALRRGGLDGNACSGLETIFRRCEVARFAGNAVDAPNADAARQIINELHELLKKCEKVRV